MGMFYIYMKEIAAIHHCERHTTEPEWENEYDSTGSKLLKVSTTYKPDGSFLIEETEKDSSQCVKVEATCIGNHDLRVEADGVITDVRLAVYSKDQTKHIHIWHGLHHHHFKQKIGLELSDEDDLEHKP
ncbi:hypothetical protein COP1_031207 [Malus domestica]